MKFVGVREAQARLSGLVELAQKERIVLTRHGHPIAILLGVQGKDLEEVLLGQDPQFRKLIDERRRSQGELVAHSTLEKQAKRELARDGKGAPSPGRSGRAAKR